MRHWESDMTGNDAGKHAEMCPILFPSPFPGVKAMFPRAEERAMHQQEQHPAAMHWIMEVQIDTFSHLLC